MFTLTDVILIVLLAIFTIGGFVLGLIQTIGALIGLVGGLWTAINLYQPVAGWLAPYLWNQIGAAKIISFIVIFVLINRLVGILFWLIERAFHLIAIIPFLKSINRLAGMILGLIEGVLVLGVAVYVAAKFANNVSWLVNMLDGSKVAHFLVWCVQFLSGFLP